MPNGNIAIGLTPITEWANQNIIRMIKFAACVRRPR